MSEEEGGECPLTHCLGCLSLLYQFVTTAQSDKQLQVGRREGGVGAGGGGGGGGGGGERRSKGKGWREGKGDWEGKEREECCRGDERRWEKGEGTGGMVAKC